MLPWAWDAYATSHLSAEACTQRLVAGCGDGYQVTGISLQQQQLARSPRSRFTPKTWFTQNGRALDDRSSGEAAS